MKLKFFYFLCSLSLLLFSKLSIAQDRCSDLFKDSGKKKNFPSFQKAQNIVQSKDSQPTGKKKNFPSFQSQPTHKTVQNKKGRKNKDFPSYQKAQSKKLGLPSHPEKHYLLDWENWKHFLGTKK